MEGMYVVDRYPFNTNFCVSNHESTLFYSHNGTYVNLLKIGHGMATQVVHGDVLGLVVPQGRDPDNLQGTFSCFHCFR